MPHVGPVWAPSPLQDFNRVQKSPSKRRARKELTFSLLPAYDDAEVEVAHTAKGAEVEHASVSAHLTGMGTCPEISHFYDLSVLADPSPNHPASLKKGRATASWTTAFPPVSRMQRPPTSIFETGLKVLKAPKGLPLRGVEAEGFQLGHAQSLDFGN